MSSAIQSEWRSLPNVSLTNVTLMYIETVLRFPSVAPIQALTLPLLLNNKDVVVEAMTGSGKTLAYVIPCMEMILKKNAVEPVLPPQTLSVFVLPSRELATQVAFETRRYAKYVNSQLSTNFSVCCFVGGRDISTDLQFCEAHGATIIVGTPGRLCELLTSNSYAGRFDLSRFELLVLDEADRLLEFGFRAKLDSLLRRCPKQRRTALLSATQTTELADLARAGMRDPVAVTARPNDSASSSVLPQKPVIPELLENFYIIVKYCSKLDALTELLKMHLHGKILVYTLNCAMVDWLAHALQILLDGTDACLLALHGRLPMKQRTRAHNAIRTARSAVLVCTDVAARGLDLPLVDVVIQFDAPVAPTTFIHRIGRTARMGKSGRSFIFLSPSELSYVEFMRMQNVLLEPLTNLQSIVGTLETPDVRRTLRSAPLPRRTFTGKKRQRDEAPTPSAVVQGDLCTSPAILALRRSAMADGELLKKAARAFVSFIRSYKEHECRYIFELRKIDITDLIHGFGLFRVPNCSEIRKMAHVQIPLQAEFDFFLEKLAAEKRRIVPPRGEDRGTAEAPISLVHERNLRKARIKKMRNLSKSERKHEWEEAELDELRRESYLLKLQRKGKISGERLSQLVGDDAQENAFLSTRERKAAGQGARKSSVP